MISRASINLLPPTLCFIWVNFLLISFLQWPAFASAHNNMSDLGPRLQWHILTRSGPSCQMMWCINTINEYPHTWESSLLSSWLSFWVSVFSHFSWLRSPFELLTELRIFKHSDVFIVNIQVMWIFYCKYFCHCFCMSFFHLHHSSNSLLFSASNLVLAAYRISSHNHTFPPSFALPKNGGATIMRSQLFLVHLEELCGPVRTHPE